MKKLNHLTLARGEATGHHHTITKGDAELYENTNRIKFLKVKKTAILTHQEHKPVEIPVNHEFYEIGQVQEYDHFEEESREVRD